MTRLKQCTTPQPNRAAGTLRVDFRSPITFQEKFVDVLRFARSPNLMINTKFINKLWSINIAWHPTGCGCHGMEGNVGTLCGTWDNYTVVQVFLLRGLGDGRSKHQLLSTSATTSIEVKKYILRK